AADKTFRAAPVTSSAAMAPEIVAARGNSVVTAEQLEIRPPTEAARALPKTAATVRLLARTAPVPAPEIAPRPAAEREVAPSMAPVVAVQPLARKANADRPAAADPRLHAPVAVVAESVAADHVGVVVGRVAVAARVEAAAGVEAEAAGA